MSGSPAREKQDAQKITRGRAALFAAILLLVPLLFFVLVAEVFVRVALPQREAAGWLRADPVLGSVGRPGYVGEYPFLRTDYRMPVRMNRRGFRDAEWAAATSDTKTIAFVGDSFTFGFAIDEDERMDRVLAQTLPPDWRTVNLGLSGWGVLQATENLRAYLAELRPEIVIFTYCIENDPLDDVFFVAPEVFPGKHYFFEKNWLIAHSHLVRYVLSLLYLYSHNAHLAAWTAQQPADAQAVNFPPYPDGAWALSADAMRALRDTVRAIVPEAVVYVLATRPDDPAAAQFLASLDDGAGLRYLDLAPIVAGKPFEDWHRPFDAHWNAWMHAAVAAQLRVRLAQDRALAGMPTQSPAP